LEHQEAESALKQARASEQQAQTQLRQLRELKAPVAEQTELQAQAHLMNARNNLARSMELFEKGFIGAAAKDDAVRTFEIAQSQLQINQRQTASLQSGGSEIALAEAALQQARAAVSAASARLQYSTIQAPKSGTLIDRNIETGDGVQPGKLLMVLSPQGTTQLVLHIDEKNIKWLRLNQKAIASSDAFPDQKFQAELAYINPKVDPQRGSVEIKLNVLQPPANLKQDMTVSVDIETTRIENTVLIPISAVHDISTPAPWAFVFQDGLAHKQALSLGLVSQGVAQVLSGLKPGDRVVSTQAPRVREGSRIRMQAP
jgi:HlyD family secretion protein